jgi:hypothetical protein
LCSTYTGSVLERTTMRALPLVNRAADFAPVAPACCNVCRTCTTTNVLGLVLGAAAGSFYGLTRFVRGLTSTS